MVQIASIIDKELVIGKDPLSQQVAAQMGSSFSAYITNVYLPLTSVLTTQISRNLQQRMRSDARQLEKETND